MNDDAMRRALLVNSALLRAIATFAHLGDRTSARVHLPDGTISVTLGEALDLADAALEPAAAAVSDDR